ncbi:hypothetical protein YW7DRAFT_03767 [Streptomyces sp. AmelKG-E11A]|nr:hypothetical protein YW7DRAFT_03767 [Streptomyces sp. AmelKG-E11A]
MRRPVSLVTAAPLCAGCSNGEKEYALTVTGGFGFAAA